ncbi:AAA family ATPase [Clostridium sp. 'deep sea']|uniref:nucleoside-triphosphatase n=1 Tax=Clostridium sp. 'deep sea' TaxID=2779445 RepID=UPI00189678FE|nr:nucleoside-triphosphatase [Clostridium sp. 'deep sea']QOR35180.1 AAA family ATPase [Clostridium sp. 'deep sea']
MKKKIFITAKPRTGKSTAIKKVVDLIGKENCYGFYTEEIRIDGKREGFKIITMDGREGILASTRSESKVRLSRYGLELDTFEELCISSITNLPNTDKLIIIDEVGPIQMFSESFKKTLIEVIKEPNPIIGTIFFKDHPWIDEFKNRAEVSLIEITFDNRDEIPKKLIEGFEIS